MEQQVTKLNKQLLIIGLILILPSWAFGAYTETHFVCSNGNGAGNEDGTTEGDCWDGDDAIVWDTDDSADDKVGPNDALYLCTDGVYRETFTIDQPGTSGKPITLLAEDGETPIISGADVVSTWTAFSSSVYTEIWDAKAQTGDSTWEDMVSHEAERNWRNHIMNASITASATKIRLTFQGSTALAYTISNCAIGLKKAASDPYDYDGVSGTNITFDSESDSAEIPQSGTKVTDDITFTLDSSKDYLIAINLPNPHGLVRLEGNGTAWYKDATDETETEDVSTYNANTSIRGISYIHKVEDPNANTWQATLNTEPYSVWMDGTYLTKGSDQYSLNDHEWFWVGNVLYVRDATGDPDGSVVITASQRNNSIFADGKSYINLDGLSAGWTQQEGIFFDENGTQGGHIGIANCVVTETGYNGIETQCTDTTIDTCTVSYTNRRGHEDHGGAICFFSGWGITVGIVKDCTVSYAMGATGQGINISNSADGITVQRNHVSHTQDDGIKLYAGSIDCIIEENWVHDWGEANGTGNIGISLYSSGADITGNIIRYNLIYDGSGSGIELKESGADDITNNYIHNNIIYNSNTGAQANAGSIRFTDVSAVNYVYNNTIHGSGSHGLWIGDSSEDQVIENNIFSANTSEDMVVEAGATTGHTIDYNMYYRGAGDIIDWGGTGYDISEWAAYKAASSQDANSPSPADPLFKDAGGSDFTLKPASPCRNAAVYISGYITKLHWNSVWPSGVIYIDGYRNMGPFESPGGAAGM